MSSEPAVSTTQSSLRRVAVIGAGSWGTALASLLTAKGHEVTLWAREPEVIEQIRSSRENRLFLPNFTLPETLVVANQLDIAVQGAEFLVSAVPSQFVHTVLDQIVSHLSPDVHIISASKGIETSSLRRMDQVFSAALPAAMMERFTALSGPSFALEVAQGEPTAVVVASRLPTAAAAAQDLFQTPRFRVYTTGDVIGVELAGALKNVIALAAGVVAGLGFGHNTLAALITRGLAEMTRLGTAVGASAATFAGLAGMGDLVLTCTGGLSRNRTVGYRLGQGESLNEILSGMSSVAEGVPTTQAVCELARKQQVEIPICEEVFAILFEGRDPGAALENLMLREPKAED